MQNKANFQKSQMFITIVSTTNYNEKLKMDTWSKRTQTKPILPTYAAGKIALSEACGEQACLEHTCPECNRRSRKSRTVEGPMMF
jgi:hypothetical protein